MAKKKKDKAHAKPSVKVQDLAPEKDPKGGLNYAKFDTAGKMENKLNAGIKDSLKLNTNLSLTDSSFKFLK